MGVEGGEGGGTGWRSKIRAGLQEQDNQAVLELTLCGMNY